MMKVVETVMRQLQHLSLEETTCHNWQDAFFEYEYLPWQWTPMTPAERTPLLTFRLTSTSATSVGAEALQSYNYGLYMLNIPVWISVMAFTVGSAVIALPTAILVYYVIVRPQQRRHQEEEEETVSTASTNPTNGTCESVTAADIAASPENTVAAPLEQPRPRRWKGTTWTGYAVGWLILVPCWIILPVTVLDQYVSLVENLLIRFCILVITPTVSLFRVTEALYGFAPSYASASLGRYCLYFCFPLPLVHNPKTGDFVKGVAATPYFIGYLVRLVLTGFYQSLLVCWDILPTYAQGPAAIPDHYFTWKSLSDPLILRESLAIALLLQLYLSTFGLALQWLTTILSGGCQAETLFHNPMMCATSISDFWSRRWNMAIHQCLKNGVYKPVRALGGGPALAVAFAFTASGLFHEWLLPNVFHRFPNTHGVTLLFFWWQAALLILEATGIGRVARNWPKPLKTVCVVALGIPTAHWFIDSYWRSDFFVHAELLFPMILPINEK